MTVAQVDDVQQVWQKIRSWPQPMQLSLAAKILQSLEAEQTRPKSRSRIWSASWKPTSRRRRTTKFKQILEEERMRKYG